MNVAQSNVEVIIAQAAFILREDNIAFRDLIQIPLHGGVMPLASIFF